MFNMSNRQRKREGKKHVVKKRTSLKDRKVKVGKDGRGVLKKSKAIEVIRSGRFSGRSLSIRKGAGGGGNKKNKRPVWYEGAPLKNLGGDKYESSIYSVARKDL